LPQPDGAYVMDVVGGVGGELRRVAAAREGSPVLDPKLSPDGRWVAFVQDAELRLAGTYTRQISAQTEPLLARNTPSTPPYTL